MQADVKGDRHRNRRGNNDMGFSRLKDFMPTQAFTGEFKP